MKLSVTSAKFLLLQEQWVVQQRQSIEDIKIELNKSAQSVIVRHTNLPPLPVLARRS